VLEAGRDFFFPHVAPNASDNSGKPNQQAATQAQQAHEFAES
jgi:hypothetical protein